MKLRSYSYSRAHSGLKLGAGPLPFVGSVLIAFMLDDYLEFLLDQVNPANRIVVRAQREIALRFGQARQDD